jgi:hypothetical protein
LLWTWSPRGIYNASSTHLTAQLITEELLSVSRVRFETRPSGE